MTSASSVASAYVLPSGGKLAALARTEAEQALVAAGIVRANLAMANGADVRRAYLAARRALAKGAPLFRLRAPMGSEPLLGPRRSGDAAGGALLALDAALARGDAAAATEHAASVERALELVRVEALQKGAPVEASALALSDAAYDLGSRILESTADAPDGEDAALADMRGALDGLDEGSAALAEDLGDAARPELAAIQRESTAIRAALDAANEAVGPSDRGLLAVATGRLGAAIRTMAAAGGARVRLPYPARIPVAENRIDEPVSALTLPGPRLGASRDRNAAQERVFAEIGRELFTDVRLSRDGKRSCATCHDPKRYFTDGLTTPRSLDPATQSLRHTPTLLYAPIEAAQLWDGRITAPEAQALHVIHSRAEMGLNEAELEAAVSAVDAYRTALAGVAASRVTSTEIAAALVAFESAALVPADAPIDRLARGDASALSPEERAGLDVFAGRGRCARCHVPPLFGGSRPRDFAVAVFSVIGVPADPSGRALDADRGRSAVTGRAGDEHSMKTPTLRDVVRTAPYFHNGRFARLEDVVAFYDKGGGRGLGLTVENQDPDVRPLKLDADATRALLAFMKAALLDASPPERAMARPE